MDATNQKKRTKEKGTRHYRLSPKKLYFSAWLKTRFAQKSAGADFECVATPLGGKYMDVFHQTLSHFIRKLKPFRWR
jgi:hypothetical protein